MCNNIQGKIRFGFLMERKYTATKALSIIFVVPIFLPPYCPIYNPIEILFGLMKSRMQRDFAECKVSVAGLPLFVSNELIKFRGYNCREIYRKCGYGSAMCFNPGLNYTSTEGAMVQTQVSFEKYTVILKYIL